MPPIDDELLITEEAAKLTKMSASWFANKRWEERRRFCDEPGRFVTRSEN